MGTSGSTQGEMKETKPPTKAIRAEPRLRSSISPPSLVTISRPIEPRASLSTTTRSRAMSMPTKISRTPEMTPTRGIQRFILRRNSVDAPRATPTSRKGMPSPAA